VVVPNCRCSFVTRPEAPVISKQAVTDFWREFFEQAPRAHIDVEEVFGGGLLCVLRWRYTWGDGANEHVRGTDLYRMKDGLIYEKLSYVKG